PRIPAVMIAERLSERAAALLCPATSEQRRCSSLATGMQRPAMPAKRREERDVGDSEYGGMSSPDAPTSYPGDIDEQPAGAPQSSDQTTYDLDSDIQAAGAVIGAVVGATVGTVVGAEAGPAGSQVAAIAG